MRQKESGEMTIRHTARAAVSNETAPNIEKRHQRNYHRLYVRRDGSLHWGEESSADTQLIDHGAASFAPVPNVALVGTGSIGCDCDWCADGGTVDVSDVDGDEIDAVEACMLDEFDTIPRGYFDDEAVSHA